MKSKLRVGILFGGRSGEHEVSLLSAASVLKAIDRRKYEVVPIGITKEGRWVTASDATRLLNGEAHAEPKQLRAGDPEATSAAAVLAKGESVIVPPVPSQGGTGALVPFETQAATASGQTLNLDVIFPVLHGTFGEDGTIQGLFELAGIAYVGSGVLGSATGMDKDVMKKLFAAAKLPIPKHVSFLRADWEANKKKTIAKIEAALKYPLFVKPANLGSSVGISKAHDRKELGPAIELAASFDRKIVVEQGVGGKRGKARELEVAVLGNDKPEVSVVGEIVPGKEFYDYEAKYLSEGSIPVIPAKLTKQQTKQIQQMAIAAFQACDCSGLARVDFLMDPGASGRIYLNEINTLPGFTSISMYPKLWAASGVAYPKLIDRLIELALERRAEKDRTSFSR
ncbi:D-alanine--D-alanine ligase family protein [Silvibacterium acidisoli]|uniref:D-alanine--D-alanine ligase family protein n=1 Tax=Acidobacteriaceae bacterium ZG23-2 TaxID=2883246 RepID=UPI00406C821F